MKDTEYKEYVKRIEDFLFPYGYPKVNEKGEGVPAHSDIKSSNIIDKQYIEIDDRISNLELRLNRRLGDKRREILKFIGSINHSHKGFTRDQLSSRFQYTSNYARKLIHELRKEKLIVSTGKRIGHRMTYFLSNMQDYIPLKHLQYCNYFNNNLLEEHSCLNRDIVVVLLKELSHTNGVYHNFRLQTKLLDKRLYEMLDSTNKSPDNNSSINDNNNVQWKLQSTKNKVKFCNPRLPRFRSSTLQVSPNGMVEIYVRASNNPYELKNATGLSEFMADLGKIEAIFHSELKSFSPIERFLEWKIVRMEFNKDIKLGDGYLKTNGNSILKVRYLSHLYQFYTKQLPEKGLILRLEEILSNHKPYPTIMEFISS